MTGQRRVALRNVLAQTASSAVIEADGSLVVELYDFSAEAHRWLGNDVAFLLRLGAPEKARMLARLLTAQGSPDGADADELLLRLVRERFADYYDVKQWLEAEGIPFGHEFEPWA
jgi:hypothetical protein